MIKTIELKLSYKYLIIVKKSCKSYFIVCINIVINISISVLFLTLISNLF